MAITTDERINPKKKSKLQRETARKERQKKARQAYNRYKKDEDERKKRGGVASSYTEAQTKGTSKYNNRQSANANNARNNARELASTYKNKARKSSSDAYKKYDNQKESTKNVNRGYSDWLKKQKEKQQKSADTWNEHRAKVAQKRDDILNSYYKRVHGHSGGDVGKAIERAKHIDANNVYHDTTNPKMIRTNFADENERLKAKAKDDIETKVNNIFSNQYALKQYVDKNMSNEQALAMFNYYQKHKDEADKIKNDIINSQLQEAYKNIDKEMPAYTEEKFLTSDDMAKITTNLLYNPELRKKGLDKKLAKKLGDVEAQQYFTKGGRFGQGLIEGASPVNVARGGTDNTGATFSDRAQKFKEAGQASTSYNVGYGVGQMANYLLMGGGGALETGLAQTALKGGSTTFAKNFAIKRGADLVVNSPLNALDAAKMSVDSDGKVNFKEAGKMMALNSLLDMGVGGGMDAISGVMKSAQIKKAVVIQNKLKSGQELTASENKLLTKLTQTAKSDEKSGWTKYDNTVKDTARANGEANSGVYDALNNERAYGRTGADMKAQDTSVIKIKKHHTNADADNIIKYHNSTNKGIVDFVNKIKNLKDTNVASKLNHRLSEVSAREIDTIKAKTGIDVTGYHHNLSGSTVNHVITRHGGVLRKKKKPHDNLMRFSEDISRCEYIMNNFDNVSLEDDAKLKSLASIWQGSKDTDVKLIKFEKKINGTYYVVEAVPETNQKRLQIVSAYMTSPDKKTKEMVNGNKKNSTVTGEHSQMTPHLTSETSDTSAISNKSIADGEENVNGNNVPEPRDVDVALQKAKEGLNKAQKELRGANRYVRNSRKVHGNPSEKALNARQKASDAYTEAKRQYAKAKTAVEIADGDTSSIAKIDGGKPKGEKKTKASEWTDKSNNVISSAWRAVGDSFASIERLANKMDAENASELRAILNRLRTVKTLNSLAITGKGKRGIGQLNWKGETVGKSLDDITDEAHFKNKLGKKVESQVQDDSSFRKLFGKTTKEQDYDYYCRLKSNYDHHLRNDTNGLIFKADVLDAKKNLEVINELEKVYGKELKDYQQAIVAFARNDLMYSVDGGMANRAKAKGLIERNPNYVPATRVVDFENYDALSPLDEYNLRSAFKKREGDNNFNLVPLHDALAVRNSKILKQTEMNNLLNFISNTTMLKKVDKGALREELSDVDAVNSLGKIVQITKDKNSQSFVNFFDGETGKPKSVLIPNDAVKGLMEWTGEEQLAFLKFGLIRTAIGVTTKANQMFKNLITGWNPIFGAKNLVRDSQTALINTRYGVGNYIRNYGRAVHQMTTKGELFKLYKQNGGQFSTMVKGDTDIGKLRNLAKVNPLNALEEFNNAMETLPRFAEFCASAEESFKKQVGKAEFNKLKKLGESEFTTQMAKKLDRKGAITAVSDAKEVTVNFARSGAIGNLLNSSVVPYFNPALQGMYKVGKRGQEAFQKSIMDGIVYLGKFAMLGASAGVIYEEIMKDNKDYQQLSSYTKNTYYCVPLKDGYFLKVPKARDISAFQVPFEHYIRTAQIGTPDGTWLDVFHTAKDQIGPVDPFKENLFSPLYRLKTNKNWYGGNIDTEEDLLKPSEQRWDENTSELAKHLGNQEWAKKIEMSPKKIDNVLDSYTGMLYDFYFQNTSLAGKDHGNWSPVINNFVVDSVAKNQNGSNFYLEGNKYYEMLDNAEAGTKEHAKAERWIRQYSYPSSTVTSAIDDIQLNPEIKDKEKYKKLRELKRIQNNIQWSALQKKDVKVDAISEVVGVLGIEDTFSSERIMRKKDKDGKDKPSTYYDGYATLKELPAFKKANDDGKKKLEKDFFAEYQKCAKIEIEAGGSPSNPDYGTLYFATRTATKNADGKPINNAVKDIFKDVAYNSTKKNIDDYLDKYNGNVKDYTKAYKDIVSGAVDSGLDYPSKMSRGGKALSLAKGNNNDAQYVAMGVERKVNAARGANQDKISSKKYEDWYSKNGFNGYSSADEIEKAIEKTDWIDTDKKKAEVFALTYSRFSGSTKWGSIADYTSDGDVGVESGYGGRSGHHRRRSGHHRRRGHRGGGGNASATITPYADWLSEHTGSSSSTTSKASSYSSARKTTYTKSNLTDAFKKQQLKKLRSTTGTIK